MSPFVQIAAWPLGDRRALYRKLRLAATVTTPDRVITMCRGWVGEHQRNEMTEAAK